MPCPSASSSTENVLPFHSCMSSRPRMPLLNVVARYSMMPLVDDSTMASGPVKSPGTDGAAGGW